MKISFPVININQNKNINKSILERKKEQTYSSTVDVLNYLNNTSLSFQGRLGIPVYAIFKDGSYQKFKSKKEAAIELDKHPSDICRSSRENSGNKREVIFVEARKIDTKLPDGSIVPDKRKLNELMKNFRSEIYALGKNGELIKFETRKQAEDALKLDGGSITHCLHGKVKTVGGYTFMYAKDIEQIDENGNTHIPQQKINELLYSLNNQYSVYSISKKGDFKKFSSQIEASRYYNFPDNAVRKCTRGDVKTVHGITFVKAMEIEKMNEDGSIEIDNEKLEKILKRFKTPIYAIDEKGNYIKFETRKQAEDALKLDGASISACLSGKVNRVGAYTFITADKIEEKKENGLVEILESKLKEALLNFKTALYAVDKEGNYILFTSRKEAEEELKLDGPSISHCLQGKVKTVGGYTFIRANEIDISGNIDAQIKAKVDNRFEANKGSKVIAIFPDKTTKEFVNAREAAKELNLDPSSIYKNIKGEQKSVKGIVFQKKDNEENKNNAI